MSGERLQRSGVGLALAVVMLNTGCASLPATSGHGPLLAFRPFSTSAQMVRSAAGGVYPGQELAATADGADEPLGFRRVPLAEESEGAGSSDSKAVAGGRAFTCGGKAVPSGWPHLGSSREVLEPFLECASPAEFVAMQRGVDMSLLVDSLEDWDAVRLGALGPLDAKASEVLGRKRAAFLVTSVEKYGVPYAEVLAFFVLHSAFDDELREVVQLLARDKQLRETLGAMASVREEMKRRGLSLEGFPERGEQGRDVLRGLGRAGRDMLASIPLSGEAQFSDLMSVKRGQLPPPYQAALDEVWKALMERHFSPGSVSVGAFDHLTFGVPVGFYHLVAGTGYGAYSLAQGKYEQATRELAPAALMVGLYAGGKGARAFREAGLSGPGGARAQAMVPRVEALKAVLERFEAKLGASAVGELARYFQQSREAALLAAEWGDAAALALHESRGNVPKARQAMLSVANSDRAGPAATQTRDTPGRVSVDEVLGRETATSLPERADAGVKVSAKDIKGARPYGPDGRPGHPDAHGVSRQDQANIINDPKSTLYRGTNANNRPVDHYHRDGTTVVTEQGEPTRVITAFGTLATKDGRGRPINRGTGRPANPLPNGGPYEKLR